MTYGLIGRPLSHSYSPQIHKLLTGCEYSLFDLPEREVAAFIRRPDIGGLNVTIPYKQTVVPLCDALSPEAARIGSVNTLVYGPDRRITGHNTDYEGFRRMLLGAGLDPRGQRAAVLGNGGAARTVRAVLRDMGAAEILTLSRTPGPDTVSYADTAALAQTELVVNTTPVGMYPHCPDQPVSLSAFPRCRGFADLIYNPLRTALCFEAEERGIPRCSGLTMLVEQARAAAELFFGAPIPPERGREALQTLQKQQTNIVLIGMPGCGKSTVGRKLAEALGRPFVDLDQEVARASGKSVPDLFAAGGEKLFRRWERQTAEEWGKKAGLVIAAGGGVVTDPANYRPLKQNGVLVFLRRPVEKLATRGRPLSQGGDLAEMYARRLPLYLAFRDLEADNDRPVEETVEELKEMFR